MIHKKQEIFYLIILFIFSITFNQHYGNLGINPIDSFWSFNEAYDILNGRYPFKDYWAITGSFIAFTQAILFKIFGVSWFIYVLQASIFNFVIALCTFYTLYNFKLKIHYCFIYALLVSILAYPSSGTPYVDHQASILSIIAVFCFILALKKNNAIYWFILPIIIGLSFLTKQTPTGHIFLIIVFLSTIYFIFNFSLKNIIFGIVGSLIFILLFLIILSVGKIPLNAFFEQYILYPVSLGEDRLEVLFPLEFKRIFLRYKLIHFSTLIIVIVCIKKIIENYKYLINYNFLIAASLIASSYAFIVHQLMTINGLFIFFIIPILVGFSHIYYSKYFKERKYILFFLIFFSIFSTIHYGHKYIHKRDFMDLRKVNMKNAIDANVLDEKLSGLKWITPFYPNNPKKETSLLSDAIKIIKKDTRKKTIVTDYQFIPVVLSLYDYSPSNVWYNTHVNPNASSEYFNAYKKFFIDKLVENEIEVAYLVKPLWGGNQVFEIPFEQNCMKKENLTEILDIYFLSDCKGFKK